jgi:integrase
MPRSIKAPTLVTRSARLRLPLRHRPYFATVGRGLQVGYRRCKTAGSWSIKRADGSGSSWQKLFAAADDYQDANGSTVLTFWQAIAKAREIAGGETEAAADDPARPVTIDMAIDAYAADLAARTAAPTNATWLRHRMPKGLRSKVLALIEAKELRQWRDALVAEGRMERSSINRLMKSAKACFTHAADLDPKRIRNRDAWSVGLQALPDAERSRNVVISIPETKRVVEASYAVSEPFGLLVEVAAVTGSRVSQIARLTCSDVQPDRILMPVSRKGRGRRATDKKPLPIPPSLALRMLTLAKGRDLEAVLLLQPDGRPWLTARHGRKFQAAAAAAGLDPAKVTIGALRHSSITRQLLRGTPVRLVADSHDTSVGQIEKTYSKYISHHGDAMLRAGMLDMSEPADDSSNVVPLARGDRPA